MLRIISKGACPSGRTSSRRRSIFTVSQLHLSNSASINRNASEGLFNVLVKNQDIENSSAALQMQRSSHTVIDIRSKELPFDERTEFNHMIVICIEMLRCICNAAESHSKDPLNSGSACSFTSVKRTSKPPTAPPPGCPAERGPMRLPIRTPLQVVFQLLGPALV